MAPDAAAMAKLLQYLWSGIDPTNPADGGPECIGQVSVPARAAISIPGMCLAVFLFSSRLPICARTSQRDSSAKAIYLSGLVRAMGWVQIFGLMLQLKFKLVSGTLIYMLMPCHLVGLMQTYLCFRHNLTLFRIMVHYGLYGATLAMLMPEVSTLHQTGEVFFYWVEHIQLVLVPILLVLSGTYSTEPLADMSYAFCGMAVNLCVALGFHQTLSVLVQGNFNLMGCANGSLPEPMFLGVNMYQWVGCTGCCVAGCLVFGKLFSVVFLKPFEAVKENEQKNR